MAETPKITIPHEAWDAVLAATRNASVEARSDQQLAVEAAAPLIVAAELERLADEVLTSDYPGGGVKGEGINSGIGIASMLVRQRAAVLRVSGVSADGGEKQS